jgi:hypothetical protein
MPHNRVDPRLAPDDAVIAGVTQMGQAALSAPIRTRRWGDALFEGRPTGRSSGAPGSAGNLNPACARLPRIRKGRAARAEETFAWPGRSELPIVRRQRRHVGAEEHASIPMTEADES